MRKLRMRIRVLKVNGCWWWWCDDCAGGDFTYRRIDGWRFAIRAAFSHAAAHNAAVSEPPC